MFSQAICEQATTKKLSQKICFLTSDDPAAAGRFLQDNCEVKPHDSTTMYCTTYSGRVNVRVWPKENTGHIRHSYVP